MSILGKTADLLRKSFPKNVGKSERNIRLIVGIALVGLSFSGSVTPSQEFWLVAVGWLGVMSGIIGHCPVYSLFGKDTAKDEEG